MRSREAFRYSVGVVTETPEDYGTMSMDGQSQVERGEEQMEPARRARRDTP